MEFTFGAIGLNIPIVGYVYSFSGVLQGNICSSYCVKRFVQYPDSVTSSSLVCIFALCIHAVIKLRNLIDHWMDGVVWANNGVFYTGFQ